MHYRIQPYLRPMVLMCLFVVGVVPPLTAQRGRGSAAPSSMHPSIGVRGGRYFTFDAWTLGGQLELPVSRELVFAPSADWLYMNGTRNWQVNIDALLRTPNASPLSIGVGLAILRREFVSVDDITSQIDAGLNVFLRLSPVEPTLGIVRPFIETRFTRVTRQNPIQLTVGVTFSPGG